jgi:radical SAM superfamily enzyme YgiQ (UPF0313 family)
MQVNVQAALQFGYAAKALKSDSYVVLGGPGASALSTELVANNSHVDAVVRGEGEETFVKLVGSYLASVTPGGIPGIVWRDGDSIVDNGAATLIDSLDTLAPPAWDLVEFSRYRELNAYVPVLAARGCTSSCPFCPSPAFWQYKVRRHSPITFVGQIASVLNRQCSQVYIADDDFGGDAEYAESTVALMLKGAMPVRWRCNVRVDSLSPTLLGSMSRAGCDRITIGLESASSGIRAAIGKGMFHNEDIRKVVAVADDLGVEVKINLMFGSPSETRDDIRQSLEFVQELRPSLVTLSTMAVYPQTRLENRVRSRRGAELALVGLGSAGLPVFVDEKWLETEIDEVQREIGFNIPRAGGW